MIPALEEVGSRFESGEYFLPEMLISARAMRAAMEVLRPHLSAADAPSLGTFVMGTVAGDIHDIGKDMVDIMLEGAGFEVIDLGVNVPAARFVAAIEEHRPVVVGMSAFLTTTMPQIGRTIEAIRAAGLRDDVRIIIGGAPIDETFAAEVGADALCARCELRRARHEGAPGLTRRILALARRARAHFARRSRGPRTRPVWSPRPDR